MGSDHLPIIITLNASVVHYASRPIAWAINEEKCSAWNKRLEELPKSQNFIEITDSATATTVFTDGLEASNEQSFRRTSPSCRVSHKGPAHSWWDEECMTAVKEASRAFREWRYSPKSTSKREEWRKAEARKRRPSSRPKRMHGQPSLLTLGPNDQPKMWAFVRNMVGNGSDAFATGQALSADNRLFEVAIRNKIRSRNADPLNDAFTPEELEKAMTKSKSNATEPDLIQR
jgi:hypothetical protein